MSWHKKPILTERIPWRDEERALVNDLLDESERTGKKIRWSRYNHQLGKHSKSAVAAFVADIREKRRQARYRALMKIQGKADARGSGQLPIHMPPAAPIKPRNIGLDHRIATSKLQFDPIILGRIADQGVTAGLLGDPIPGRSALDRKRASA